MRLSFLLLIFIPTSFCAPSPHVAQVVLDADGGTETDLHPLLRKEAQPNMLQEDAVGDLTQQQPTSGFNSSSGLWKEIRKRAKVTAVEPFSADAPPTVVYTGQTASAAATILISTTTCFSAIAWAVQSKMKFVKEATWQTLGPAMAMFCALQLFYILREVTNLMVADNVATEEVSLKGLRPEDAPAVAASGAGSVGVSFARFVLAYAALQSIFVMSRQRKLAMEIAASFGSQLVGLLAADACATWQETPYWNTAGMIFAFVLLSAVVLALVLVPASMLRVKVITADEQKAECQKSDELIACFGISLCFAQFWRFLLAGQLPHYLGVQRSSYNRSETLFLFLVWVKLFALALALDKLIARFQGPSPEGAGRFYSCFHKCMQAASVVPLAVAMTSAWCCFYWAKWATYSILVTEAVVAAGYFLKAEMYTAIMFSLLCFAATYAGMHVTEKWPHMVPSVKLSSLASIFVLSLSWNSAFQSACAFSKDSTSSEALQVFDRCLKCQWMCVLLIPVWLQLVLPHLAKKDGEDDPKKAETEAKDKAGEDKAAAKMEGQPGGGAEASQPAAPAEPEKQGEGSQPAAAEDDQY